MKRLPTLASFAAPRGGAGPIWGGPARGLALLLDTLTAKPWLPQPAPPPRLAETPAAAVALRLLLAVIGVLFALLALAFFMRAQLPDWQALRGAPGTPLADPWPLWVNTAFLLAGSLALQAASVAARRREAAHLKPLLAAAGLFALAFLAGQLAVWQRFVELGYFVATNPASSFFYLLTGIHGAHVAGGLVAWARVTLRARRDAADPRLVLGTALVARYWHFLFAVWLVLFALLASPSDTLHGLADICGLR